MTDQDPAAPQLSCLGGKPAPPFLAADMDTLLALPDSARSAFGEVLRPCLGQKLGSDIDHIVESFARKHEAAPARIAQALRGARFLLQEAARMAAAEAVVAEDLGRLAGPRAEALRAVLLRDFAEIMADLRLDIVRRTLLDHGDLLAGVDWRVDRVVASQHGRELDVLVGVLTLTIKRGSTEERITLHCDPGMLKRLRAACDEMVE